MDAIETLEHDIDVAVQVPHGDLRVYVMGDRGAHRAPATEAENQQMRDLVREAVTAGALGFSTTRTMFHRTADGDLTPTVRAEHDELKAIAMGLGDAGAGVMQFVSDFTDIDREFELLCELTQLSGRPLSFSLVQSDAMPGQWRDLLARLEAARLRDVPITGQVCGRPVGLMLGLQGSVHPLMMRPSYQDIADLPLAERVAALRAPELRAKILSEPPMKGHPFNNLLRGAYHKMYALGEPPNYEPDPADSLAARAAREGGNPDAMLYDALLEDDGHAFLFFPMHNYIDGNLDNVLEMLKSPATLTGLSDGGAHVGAICDVSLPTFMLTHWCRDRQVGERLDLATVVRNQSRDTAEAVGLFDRGRLKVGYKADINVIDFDRLQMHQPHMIYDLPAGGRRLMQGADGYEATLVSGVVIYRDGTPTEALPGRLVRGGSASPI
jgi:N-acyl-D-aspartate/D-glutamate deacylase